MQCMASEPTNRGESLIALLHHHYYHQHHHYPKEGNQANSPDNAIFFFSIAFSFGQEGDLPPNDSREGDRM